MRNPYGTRDGTQAAKWDMVTLISHPVTSWVCVQELFVLAAMQIIIHMS